MTDISSRQRHQTATSDSRSNERYPFSYYPKGWYFVAHINELQPGKLLGRRWCGAQIVAWRTDEGKICVADAYCPHLGARMTPEVGGRIVNGRLKCPFHGFEYDVSGVCTHTPNAPPPRSCQLNTYPTCERNEIVFAYHGGEPQFELPHIDDEGWTPRIWAEKKFRTHIQEIPENALDPNHFLFVHGMDSMIETKLPEVDKQYFHISSDTRVRVNMPILRRRSSESHVDFHMWGLGYFFFESTSSDSGVEARNWIFGVPELDESLTLRYAVSVRKSPSQQLKGLSWLPTRWSLLLMRKLVHMQMGITLEEDSEIWNTKRYRASPRLVDTDGSILAYRQYCRQFYTP